MSACRITAAVACVFLYTWLSALCGVRGYCYSLALAARNCLMTLPRGVFSCVTLLQFPCCLHHDPISRVIILHLLQGLAVDLHSGLRMEW